MIFLSLLCVGWCVLHSLLITAKVNDLVRRRGGAVRGSARLVYNMVATVTLAPLFWYQFSLPATTIFAWAGPWRAWGGSTRRRTRISPVSIRPESTATPAWPRR